MKAVRFHQHGDATVLRTEEVDQPVPGAGQVLVRVAGTSFNPIDAAIRAGYVRQVFPVALPYTPGVDVAGTIARLGDGVTRFEVGDQVVGFLPITSDGAAAEYVVAPVEILAAAPTAVPLADAAALPVVGLTAWQAVFEHLDVQPAQRILVHGAGGAVGGYAVQLAVQAGATVLATSGPRDADRVRGYGAEVTGRGLDTASGQFDAALNLAPVPPADMLTLAALVRPGGVLVTTTTPGPEADPRGVRSVSMYVRGDADQLATLVDRVDAGKLHLHVAERFDLTDLPAVHARSDAGALAGKTILVP